MEGERLEDGFSRGEPQHRELVDRNKRVLTVALIDERGRFTGGTRRPVALQKALRCDNADCPVHTEALYGTESPSADCRSDGPSSYSWTIIRACGHAFRSR